MKEIEMELTAYENSPSRNYSNFYPPEIINNSNINDYSKILKNPLLIGYHFLCKECKSIPKILFKKDLIKFDCECQDSPKDILIIKIKENLFKCDEDQISEILKCTKHSDIYYKYNFYCSLCEKPLCSQCYKNCKNHINKVEPISVDIRTINKLEYIYEKFNANKKNSIKDSNNFYIGQMIINNDNPIIIRNNNSNDNKSLDDINNNIDNEENLILNDNDENNNNIMNNNNSMNISNDNNNKNDINNDFLSLLSIKNESIIEESIQELINIIISDYEDFPNYKHIDIISNIENFVNLNYETCNEIILKYEINQNMKNNDEKVELFGEKFINNNAEKSFIVINEKIMNLKNDYDLFDFLEDNDKAKIKWPITLEVRLVEKPKEKITDLSFMFDGISVLKLSSDFSNFNRNSINKMSHMFYNCSTLESLPDISKIDTSNVTDMSYMFYNCSQLKSLPDISKWKTNKVIYMNYLFSKCSNLLEIPDISRWDTSNLREMDNMFSSCLLLSSFPKISDWNIKNVHTMDNIFSNCKSLKYEPKIMKWANRISSSLTYEDSYFLENIFKGCDLLILPKINRIRLSMKIKNFCRYIFNKFCFFIHKCLSYYCILNCLLMISIPFFLIYYSVNLDKKKKFYYKPINIL